MLRGKKNFLTKIVCVVMVCCIMILTSSMPTRAAEGTVPEPSEEEVVSLADFYAVDQLIEQQTVALEEGDGKKYDGISKKLEKLGCEEISAGEVQQLTGGTPEDVFNSRGQSRKGASAYGATTYSAPSSEVSFLKIITTVTYGGKKYKVMKIAAKPKKEGILLRNGSVIQRYNYQIKAGSLNLLKTTVKIVGKRSKVVQAVSAYDILKNVINGFKNTTKIEKVKAVYTWTVDENCSFIYVYNSKTDSYPIAASYNKARYVISINIPYFKVVNRGGYSDVACKKYSGWVTADNYGNAYKAIDYFKKGKTYNSWVNSVQMSGCNGKSIHTVYLQHPYTAMQIGY